MGKPDTPDSDLSPGDLAAVRGYVRGWGNWTERAGLGILDESIEFDPAKAEDMLRLGYAMFCHEAAVYSPLAFEQILRGVELATSILFLRLNELGATDKADEEALVDVVRNLPGDTSAECEEEQPIIDERAKFIRELLKFDPSAKSMDADEAEVWLSTLQTLEPESQIATTQQDDHGRFLRILDELPRTGLPPITADDVRWVSNFRNHPDYAHLPEVALGRGFNVTREMIEQAMAINHFAPPAAAHGKLILAIRGAKLTDGTDSARLQLSIAITERNPSHSSLHCLIGCFDTQSGRVSLFAASTVPNAGSVAAHYNTSTDIAASSWPMPCQRDVMNTV